MCEGACPNASQLSEKDPCRSELAREKRPGDAFMLNKRGESEFFASKRSYKKS
ncbi:hypothetical protein QF045_003477 [Pseudomonas sp. W4I3]|nr:hypothetical protein [Pseudomonas sp. W4I3]